MTLRTGDALPSLAFGPITRADLALYAGASGDDNPIHIDIDFARAAGQDDVFAHGMLSMGYLSQVLTSTTPPENIKEFRVRFQSITPVKTKVQCRGEVLSIAANAQGSDNATLGLTAELEGGPVTLSGTAIISSSK